MNGAARHACARLGLVACLTACGTDPSPPAHDAGTTSPVGDARPHDASSDRARRSDAAGPAPDARIPEASQSRDAGEPDAFARPDSAVPEGAAEDARALDRAPLDSAPPAPPGYPAGPYGGNVGDTIAYMTWVGYVNPTAVGLATLEPVVPYSTDDLRRSGSRYALVHVSDFDCPGCNHAAEDLGTDGKAFVDAGAAVVEVLGSQGFVFPADKAHLTSWVDAHDLTVTSVIDAPGRELDTLGLLRYRETTVLIDLSTMKIVWKKLAGDLGGTDPTSITDAAPELARLLGD